MSESRPRRRADVTTHALGDELVLHDEKHARVHVLNATARFIWDHCNGEMSEEGLVAVMKALFPEIDETELRNDVLETLKELRFKGLVL